MLCAARALSERCDGRLLVVCSVQQWDRNDSSRVAMDLVQLAVPK